MSQFLSFTYSNHIYLPAPFIEKNLLVSTSCSQKHLYFISVSIEDRLISLYPYNSTPKNITISTIRKSF